MTQQISKQQILKEISATKVISSMYSEVARKWYVQNKISEQSHVVLYLDEKCRKLFVGVVAKPPIIYGFVMDLQNITAQPTEVRQYTMQTRKDLKTYIMADSTQFLLVGYFKAPITIPKPIQNGVRPSSRDIYRSIASTEVVNEVTGIKFHVNVELLRSDESEEAVVSFYDSRYFTERNNVGQFVSDYYVSTIRNHRGGLTLDCGVDDWYVTHRNINQIHDWLASEF